MIRNEKQLRELEKGRRFRLRVADSKKSVANLPGNR